MPLVENSQELHTFITPFSGYCPSRGPFRPSSVPETFNKRLDHIIEGLAGVAKSITNFLIYG